MYGVVLFSIYFMAATLNGAIKFKHLIFSAKYSMAINYITHEVNLGKQFAV